MRVLVYEFVSGGGLFTRPDWGPPAESLLVEGSAMLQCVVEDLAACADVQVTVQMDDRLGNLPLSEMVEVVAVSSRAEHDAALVRLGSRCDRTLLIAPEIDNALAEIAQRLESQGIRLIGPSAEFIRLASDKSHTAEVLQSQGISVPEGGLISAEVKLPADVSFPLVAKPNCGAGSLDVQWLGDRTAWVEFLQIRDVSEVRWEAYCRGRPASIAVLGGRVRAVLLPPCYQQLSGDGDFTYQGGGLITEPTEIGRCQRLAEQVLGALGCDLGYWGIDLILGDDPAGADDVVIEVNPRLTTSYAGLRSAIDGNLAQLMLDVVAGKQVSVSVAHPQLRFSAAGRVWR
jgi:predicted ATP-grasp superfamily ATP-dependent carboligase